MTVITQTVITDLEVLDVRFPTSSQLDGSDAMNPDPDYSAAYVILKTNQAELSGHGLTFTIGRGNEICCAAIEAMRHLVVGLNIDEVRANPAKMWRDLTSDSQLRWIGICVFKFCVAITVSPFLAVNFMWIGVCSSVAIR